MSTHTPGPWVACGYENLTVNDSEGNTIVATPGSSTGTRIEMKANAALIAAAPAMLEALKAILDSGRYDDAGNFVIDCEQWDGQGNPPDTTDPLCIQSAWALIEAIRLAEGRS